MYVAFIYARPKGAQQVPISLSFILFDFYLRLKEVQSPRQGDERRSLFLLLQITTLAESFHGATYKEGRRTTS